MISTLQPAQLIFARRRRRKRTTTAGKSIRDRVEVREEDSVARSDRHGSDRKGNHEHAV